MTKGNHQHKRRHIKKRIPKVLTPRKNQKLPKLAQTPKSPKKTSSSSKQIKNQSNMNTAPNHPPPSSPEKVQINYNIYYEKIINNTFNSYAKDILERLCTEEMIKSNKSFITEDILKKFGLNILFRKFTLRYLYNILSQYDINIKFYFRTISIFDSFLIGYSEQNSIEDCANFFLSKHTKTFSQTKLILLSLCCFYIANQIHNTINFDLNCLVNWNEKNELSYAELIDLVNEILIVIDCNTNLISIYDFIELFLFDIKKRLKILTDDETFLKKYSQNIIFFTMKFTQEVNFLSILKSTQALGIFAFVVEYTKFELGNDDDSEIFLLIENWTRNLIGIFHNCNINEIKNVIMWCSDYVNSH